jgi:hypothetical protein
MQLVKESRWSRQYEMDDLQTKLYESKFADGSATITVNELTDEWGGWSVVERADFCQAVTQAKFPQLADILRFIMDQGDLASLEAVANSIARNLPAEEAVPFLTDICKTVPVGKGAKFYQALALIRPAFIRDTLMACLNRTWADERFLSEDEVFDHVANDAVCLIEYLVQLGQNPNTLADKYKVLARHPNNINKQTAINRLSQFFPGYPTA